jgi:hypothetical protein
MDEFQIIGCLEATLILCILLKDTERIITLIQQSPSLSDKFLQLTSDM